MFGLGLGWWFVCLGFCCFGVWCLVLDLFCFVLVGFLIVLLLYLDVFVFCCGFGFLVVCLVGYVLVVDYLCF